MRPKGAHHVAVCVRDLARAEAFYGGVLGLPVLRRWSDGGGRPRSVWLDAGGDTFLAIERAERTEPLRDDSAPGWHCVALRIGRGEREAWRERLSRAGHPVERETDFTLYVRDPEGALVGLSHWPDASRRDTMGA